jgi:hypothetical protein
VSSKLPSLSSRKFVSVLKKGGATLVRQGATDHAIFERVTPEHVFRTPVLMGKTELSPKYIKIVLLQLGFSDREIEALFK